MRVGIAAEHAVFAIKKQLIRVMRGFERKVQKFDPSG